MRFASEYIVIQELRAYLSYRYTDKMLTYWYEVDAIIGEAEEGIEVKSATSVSSVDTKGLWAFGEEVSTSQTHSPVYGGTA